MKKFISILSVACMFGMVLSSCGKSTDQNGNDPFEKQEQKEEKKDLSFKSANIFFKALYSNDLLNLADITCTYTDIDGKTHETKLESAAGGEVVIKDAYTNLPGTFKINIKVEKSANFDTYLASKEKFDIWFNLLPIYAAGWVDKSEGEHILEQNTTLSMFEGKDATAEGIKEAFDRLVSTMSYSFSGTFEKDGDKVTFKRIEE